MRAFEMSARLCTAEAKAVSCHAQHTDQRSESRAQTQSRLRSAQARVRAAASHEGQSPPRPPLPSLLVSISTHSSILTEVAHSQDAAPARLERAVLGPQGELGHALKRTRNAGGARRSRSGDKRRIPADDSPGHVELGRRSEAGHLYGHNGLTSRILLAVPLDCRARDLAGECSLTFSR